MYLWENSIFSSIFIQGLFFFLQTLNHPYHLFLNSLVLYHPFSGEVNGITQYI